jgi:hypothetical protein
MDTDGNRWLKFRSGSEVRGPQEALTDEFAEKLGYVFALWLAERLEKDPKALALYGIMLFMHDYEYATGNYSVKD